MSLSYVYSHDDEISNYISFYDHEQKYIGTLTLYEAKQSTIVNHEQDDIYCKGHLYMIFYVFNREINAFCFSVHASKTANAEHMILIDSQ
jgi:hypothetical protein